MAFQDVHLIGQSPVFLDLLDRVSKAASTDRPVLVIGERGTGKELVAARLHFLSKRWGAPYLLMNCAALAENLLESELFGHESGAFTGATRARMGRFEAADQGTLFLDEIATMSYTVQEKLLRVIEYGTFQRLGSNETVSVDVRIIGATNVDLPSLVDRGKFRADLLDRLSFDVITVPPLRARQEDIASLAHHFGRAMAVEMGWPDFAGFTDSVMARLLAYTWPGNVRELKNAVERSVYQWPDERKAIDRIILDPFDSPFRPEQEGRIASSLKRSGEQKISGDANGADFLYGDPEGLNQDINSRVARYEKGLLEEALRLCRHNQKVTAEHLGLSYDQLRHKLKKYALL